MFTKKSFNPMPHNQVSISMLQGDFLALWNSKVIHQFGCARIIKVKIGESTGLQGALPASLIIHKRPIHLQTAGTLTNLSRLPLTIQSLPLDAHLTCLWVFGSTFCILVCVCVIFLP